jgi:uncharacterized phage-associated protein
MSRLRGSAGLRRGLRLLPGLRLHRLLLTCPQPGRAWEEKADAGRGAKVRSRLAQQTAGHPCAPSRTGRGGARQLRAASRWWFSLDLTRRDTIESAMIRFPFRERKAAQAAAHLLKLHGNEMHYLLLIKLLYLADRYALMERGLPITGDRLVSMDYGPVLSRVKDLLTMEQEPQADGTVWREYVSEPAKYKVKGRKNEPEADELSEYEMAILNEIHAEYGALDRFELSKWTHDLPEWRDPHGGSLPIDPGDILRHAGKSSDEIAEIADEAEQSAFLRKVLAIN